MGLKNYLLNYALLPENLTTIWRQHFEIHFSKENLNF